ncbi:MAG: glycosyltransferase 87 family protein [Cyanobacteriota bacterium]
MMSSHSVSGKSPFLEILSWLLFVCGIGFFLFSLVVYGVGEPYSGMGFIHPMRMQPPFADLAMLTATAECGVDLDAYYKGLVPGCDPAGRTYPFDYPPMSIWLGRWLHVRASQTPLIGVTTAMAMMVVILGLLRAEMATPWKWRLLASGVLMSFPVLQCVERANIDVMIFLMMILLAFLVSRPMRTLPAALPRDLLAGLLTFLAVSLKVFPVFGIAGLMLFRDNQRALANRIQWSSFLTKAIVLFAAAFGFVFLIHYFQTVGNLIKEGGLGSFGLMAFGYVNSDLVKSFGLVAARHVIRLLFLIKPAAILFGFFMASRSGLATPPAKSAESISCHHKSFLDVNLWIMSCTWMGAYIFTINYDYRFIFILPFLAYLATFSALWPRLLICMTLLIFVFPWFRLNYTSIGMALVRVLEPVTEFLLIPALAGSLLFFLVARILRAFLPTRPVTAEAS